MHTNFYHGTTKKMIVAFSTMFDEIEITLGDGRDIVVPLHYSQREKFVDAISKYGNRMAKTQSVTLPIMGFEFVSMNYAPERKTNTMAKIKSNVVANNEQEYMYNRVPIDYQFDLFIAVKRLEDGFKILEQIVPFFTPELTITINNLNDYNQTTNIPVSMTSMSHTIQYDESMDEIRHIEFQLSFSMKGFMFSNPRRMKQIQTMIVNMNDMDFDKKFMSVIATESGIETKEYE